MNRPQKCPHCNSSRVVVIGKSFYCRKCGYVNNTNPIIIRSK